ncbi:MAG: YggS family pyridoxal phosphate enzyme [Elusimicrobia bacterium RBG_16_66_12]|nr:MAG: YggS family pyridoxal phosphate enzyme [Elusimicrobia bacterium RBG_16_66_12]
MFIDNLNQIRYRIREASARTKRNPDAIRLVAVTKYAGLDSVRALLDSGLVAEVGESRVQDAERKKLELGGLADKVRWRLIGHLQTNKAKKAVKVFDAVDTVDSEKTAAALDAALSDRAETLPVMIQVKLTERRTQSGVDPGGLGALVETLKKYPRLKVEGLMGIAPDVEPVEAVRPSFRMLRELRDRHLPRGLLNMGMSRDFEVAVEEGADLVRIGSQIFTQPSQASMEAPE